MIMAGPPYDSIHSCCCCCCDSIHSCCCFLQLCLKEFDNNPETVINRVLEQTLPPHLKDVDFALSSCKPETAPPAPPPPAGKEESEWSYLEQRESVFDNDEFDVFRRPEQVDLSRVHIGKK